MDPFHALFFLFSLGCWLSLWVQIIVENTVLEGFYCVTEHIKNIMYVRSIHLALLIVIKFVFLFQGSWLTS